jgi:apolipoprotein N-acyltransferase
VRARVALPGAAALGVVAAAAFDPWSLPFAMVLSVAGLMWFARRLEHASRRLVVGCGLLYGLSFMAVLIWWMNAVSNGAYVALVIAQTLFYGVVLLALRAVMRLRAWPLWAAAVWVAGEWARASFPFTGFPWGRIGHTAVDTPLESYARLLGMPGTSAVMVLIAAGVLTVVEQGHRARGALGVAVLVVVGTLLPIGLADQDGTRQVALVQGNTPGDFLTWPPGAIFALHAEETQRLADRVAAGQAPRPDMVLWPENSTDTDPTAVRAASSRISDLSRQLGAPILVGGIFDGPTPTTSYNAGVVWDASGPGERYVKRRPVPYGEYVPFRESLGGLVPAFDRDIPRDMLAGDRVGTLQIAGTTIGDTICYDIAYDDVVSDAIGDGAQVIVVQTSNAAFTGTAQPEQQWDISRLRAIETGRWVLVPSTNGITGVVDAHGDAVQRAPERTPATLEIEVPLASGRTPAERIGAPLEYLLVGLALVGWVAGAKKTRGPGAEKIERGRAGMQG